MRMTVTLGITALLLALGVGAWTITQGTTGSPDAQANKAGMMDPIGMMKKAKDLPVHSILDAI